MDMGFPKKDVIEALKKCGNDLEKATAFLLGDTVDIAKEYEVGFLSFGHFYKLGHFLISLGNPPNFITLVWIHWRSNSFFSFAKRTKFVRRARELHEGPNQALQPVLHDLP